jgi:CRP-like cAMP-binding protein
VDAGNSIRQNRIFSHLDEGDLNKILARSHQRRFQSGEWIVHHGEVWPNLFFIHSGQVTAIMESPEGRSLTLATIEAGEVFWGLAFFIENAPMPAGLKATQDCEIRQWSRDDLRPFIIENGQLSWELSCLAIRRVRFASEIVEKLAFQPVAGRLARLLLDQSGDKSSAQLPRDLTLDEMAARIGSTREVVSRFLHRFADDGLINITRTEFSVTDHQKLDDLAQKVKG